MFLYHKNIYPFFSLFICIYIFTFETLLFTIIFVFCIYNQQADFCGRNFSGAKIGVNKEPRKRPFQVQILKYFCLVKCDITHVLQIVENNQCYIFCPVFFYPEFLVIIVYSTIYI